ncbi:MAG: hypothetical protein HOJ88_12320 [Proteobacteria bacterium]|jgi:hypothetical protein|nr:hypothetical protein [Pseudomonadota bacterium]
MAKPNYSFAKHQKELAKKKKKEAKRLKKLGATEQSNKDGLDNELSQVTPAEPTDSPT